MRPLLNGGTFAQTLKVVMVTVRQEHPGDLDGIHALHTASFPTVGEARLVDALRAVGRLRISLVAVEGDEVVGHIAFSPVTLEGTAGGLGLGPLAVRVGHRRRGIAGALVHDGLASCRAAPFVVVLGDPHYYGRFGFLPAREWNLQDEYAGGDAFQALELIRGSIPLGGGLVRYSPEFAALGD
jgi:putative acetyltransferase